MHEDSILLRVLFSLFGTAFWLFMIGGSYLVTPPGRVGAIVLASLWAALALGERLTPSRR